MKLSPAQIMNFPTVTQTIARAAKEWHDNKFAQAAREIASLDLSGPPLTGPPHRAKRFASGTIDVRA